MPCVFLHGLGQRASSWEPTVARLSRDLPVTCPDLTCLLSRQEATYQRLYRAFSEYCAALPGPLSLVGLSLGAILALNYAAEHPAGVQDLVLIGAQYRMPRRLLQLQNAVFRLMPASSFGSFGLEKPALMQLTQSMMALDFSSRLSSIGCATLVLCGERDRANKRAAVELAQQIPGATLRLVRGAGHEVNTEAPDALATLLTDFYLR